MATATLAPPTTAAAPDTLVTARTENGTHHDPEAHCRHIRTALTMATTSPDFTSAFARLLSDHGYADRMCRACLLPRLLTRAATLPRTDHVVVAAVATEYDRHMVRRRTERLITLANTFGWSVAHVDGAVIADGSTHPLVIKYLRLAEPFRVAVTSADGTVTVERARASLLNQRGPGLLSPPTRDELAAAYATWQSRRSRHRH